jgi:Xaa-Pro aminopeptidase
VARRARLQRALRASGIDAALITQNADLFYLSGTVQQSQLYVPAEGEPVLFVRKTLERARLESPIGRGAAGEVVDLPSLRQLGDLVRARRGGAPPKVVGLELDVLPVTHFRRYESLLPGTTFVDVGAELVRLRAVKSPYEVDRIRASAAIATQVCERIPGILRDGMTEAEFAGRVEAEARALGHQGVIRMRAFNGEMFYGQLLTGASGAVPSFLDTPLAGTGLSPAVAQGVSFKPIGRGEPVVFDFVPVLDGYVADFTRIFVLGKLPGKLRRAYETALRAQEAAAAAAQPGATCRQVWEAALAVAEGDGLGAHFMGHGPSQVRFVGHGVGLELDELPVLSPNDLVLEEGMVFALEPKFVLPGLGAIGIENTWVVTADGVERLTVAPEDVWTI